jgi:hypothetical protein
VISISDGAIVIAADTFAPRLGLELEALQAEMQRGRVCCLVEAGVDEDEGRTRVTLRYQARSWTLVIEPDGKERATTWRTGTIPSKTSATSSHRDQVAEQLRMCLQNMAAAGLTITYGGLARLLELSPPNTIHQVTVALVTFHPNVESMVRVCDVVTINCPLHPETEHMFDDELIAKMKRGAYIVNTARGKICDRDAIVRALNSGQLAGYAGDVWFPQPAPKDHPWRTMPHHGMTPHVSGTSLSAQARYAAGVREILECWFEKRPIRDEYLIVDRGKLAGAGAHSYSAGDATGGSAEAARFTRA